MKSKIKKGVFYLILGFVVLFGLRLMYGYVYVEPSDNQTARLNLPRKSVEAFKTS